MIEFIKNLFLNNFLETAALIFSVIGGIVGLKQWIKGNDYKRAAIVKELITQVRDDKEIASVMDYVDWSEGFYYDGKFHFKESADNAAIKDEQHLFVAVDRTLAHFNYICYLKSLGIFHKKDMKVFEYALQRLLDNEHICNYLHSLSLWTEILGVSCSYKHLIDYGKKKHLVSGGFGKKDSNEYHCFLDVD